MRQGRKSAGFTTLEMLVVVAILGLIVTGVVAFGAETYRQINKEAFDEEANLLCRFFNDSRKIAMMTDKKVTIAVYEDHVVRIGGGKDKTLSLSKIKINDVHGNSKWHGGTKTNGDSQLYKFVYAIKFDEKGTINVGTTYMLKGSGDNVRFLIIQPVTGRMYLSDAKPKK